MSINSRPERHPVHEMGNRPHEIFLSYGHGDEAVARRFAESLERAGFSVWWDASLRSGEAFDTAIESALNSAKAVVVLWSQASVQSRWVRAEATLADRNKTLVPVMIEACQRPIMFELAHTNDLSHWRGAADDRVWQSLLADVRRMVGVRDESAADGSAIGGARSGAAPGLARVHRIGRGRKLMAASLGILALLLIVAGVRWGLSHWGSAQVAQTAQGSVSLAVLPFVNMSADPQREYFSDGLTEEILDRLVQIDGLSVTARTSSFSFKGRNEDVRVIGSKLGVGNLLEGSIRADGNKLRITAQLVSSRDGSHLWSQTYDRELSSVFALQEEIAKDVAQALSIKLDVGDTSRARGGTTNLEAFDKYLQAVGMLNKGYNRDFAAQAAQFSREAVVLDPAFVRAWEVLARSVRSMQVWTPDKAEALHAEVAQAEARIEALAPDSPPARHIRIGRLLAQRKWLDAAALVNTAGHDPRELDWQTDFLVATGRLREMLPYTQRRCKLDPLSLACSSGLQVLLDAVGRSEDAQAEYDRSKELVGSHIEADAGAMVRAAVRKNADSATVLTRFRALLKDRNQPLALAPGLADSINGMEAARAVLRRISEDPANHEALRVFIVAYYAGALGDRDLAMTALRRGVIDLHGATGALWFAAYALERRDDPRFKDILRETGLADYFRTSGNWGDFCGPVGSDDFECH